MWTRNFENKPLTVSQTARKCWNQIFPQQNSFGVEGRGNDSGLVGVIIV